MKSKKPYLIFVILSGGLILFASFRIIFPTHVMPTSETNTIWKKNIRSIIHEIKDFRSDSFNDISFLKETVGNKRIVFLGESSHQVKEFNQIKARIVRFLVKEMGFEIIAFEGGFSECNYLNDLDISPDSMLKAAIPNVWHTQDNLELMKFIKANSVITTGFDVQFDSYSVANDYIRNLSMPIDTDLTTKLFHYDSIFLFKSKFETNTDRKIRSKIKDTLLMYFDSVYSSIVENKVILNQGGISKQRIQLGLLALEYRKEFMTLMGTDKFTMSKRDELMSGLFEQVATKIYPDKKIVVWSHNSHIMKSKPKNYPPSYIIMVEKLPDEIKNQSYNIGLYMSQGQFGAYKKIKNVAPRKANSLEDLLFFPEYKAIFLDVSLVEERNVETRWAFKKINSYYWGGPLIEKIVPKDTYDGIIMITNSSPSVQMKK